MNCVNCQAQIAEPTTLDGKVVIGPVSNAIMVCRGCCEFMHIVDNVPKRLPPEDLARMLMVRPKEMCAMMHGALLTIDARRN